MKRKHFNISKYQQNLDIQKGDMITTVYKNQITASNLMKQKLMSEDFNSYHNQVERKPVKTW